MLKLFKYVKLREWLLVLASVLLIVGQVYLDLELPDYMNKITILVQTGGAVSEVWLNGLYMLLFALGSGILSVIVGFIAARVAASFSKTLREQVFNKIEGYSMEQVKKFSTASLITRTTNDTTQVQNIVAMGLQILVKSPILAVWAVLKILNKSWQWSAATAIAVLVLFVLVVVLVIFALPKFKKVQKLTDNLNSISRENLTGIRVVRAYNAEEYETKKFEKANGEITGVQLFVNKMMAILAPAMNLVTGLLNVSIYLIGAMLISKATNIESKLVFFGDMVVFSSYAMQIVMAFVLTTMVFIMLPRATVSARRVLEVLNEESKIIDGQLVPNTNEQGTIEFKNVSFKYNDSNEYVLEDINFKVNKGQTVAFIGSTGSGKSTLVNLVMRFYDVTDGQVLVNGVDVREYKQKALNKVLGYVPQTATLFSGNIKQNLLLGDNSEMVESDEDLESAIKTSQSSFAIKLEKGLEHSVNQMGKNFSGGQKQRLSIARAVVRKPEIFIFDDSFSALDYKTDKALRKALKNELSGTTNLIVAQRIGTIKNADQIIVLDSGKIVGKGKHEDLLLNCEVYKEIALSQLSTLELENE